MRSAGDVQEFLGGFWRRGGGMATRGRREMRHPSSPTVNLSRADGDTVERVADRFAIAPAVLLHGAIVGKGLKDEI